MIRPEIQALIDRAAGGGLLVEISEIENLSCSSEESAALVSYLTNSALARRLDRTLANLPKPVGLIDTYHEALYVLSGEAMKRLERL